MIEGEHIRSLLDAESTDELLDASTAAAKELLGADDCHVIAIDDSALDVLATTESALASRDDLPVATDIIGQLDLIGRSHVFDDISDVRSVATQSTDSSGQSQPRSLLVAPIDNVGMLVATDAAPSAFDSGDRHWAERLAEFLERLVDADMDGAGDPETVQLERIATILSHDFNGPLTVARGSLTLAEESGDAEHFEQAHKAIDRIEHLVDGIERMANDDGEFPATELVELRAVVEEVWPTVDRNGETRLEIVDSRTVLADEHALEQLLSNLLSNAVDHGGDEVVVGVTDHGFFVEDNGDGIDPVDREAVFEWGHTTGDDNKGIGLCITRQLAEVHGWSLEIEESADGGARFVVTDIDE